MHTYISSRAKRKRFYRKSGFQIFFVDFRSPCWYTKAVHQHGDSIQSSIKLRETSQQITQKRCGAQTLDLERLLMY